MVNTQYGIIPLIRRSEVLHEERFAQKARVFGPPPHWVREPVSYLRSACGRSCGISREEAAMLARVVTIQVRPEKMDECIRIFRERNAPSIAAQPGFHLGGFLEGPGFDVAE